MDPEPFPAPCAERHATLRPPTLGRTGSVRSPRTYPPFLYAEGITGPVTTRITNSGLRGSPRCTV
jgi:hypothetical protein